MAVKENLELEYGLFKTAVENALDCIMLTSPDLDEPGPRIIYVNPAFTAMTGYSAGEALGRSPRFLQGEKTDRQVLKKVGRLLRQGKPIREEIVNYRKDGTEYLIEWHIAPVRAAGKIVNWVSVQRDITERKRFELNLANEKAQVERKVLERTSELEAMRRKIEHYARKLEMKLVSLEKRQSGLSERERKVLAAIASEPLATDTELSASTGIKRPTFTSIRQRLKSRGEYSEIYAPHPKAIGCEAVSLEYGDISEFKAKTRHIEERLRKQAVIYIASETHYAAAIFHRTFSDAYANGTIIIPSEFLECSFGLGLARIFGNKEAAKRPLPGPVKDREVMEVLVRHPGWAIRSVADRLGLSLGTANNARSRLLESALSKDIVPKIRGFYPIALVHSKEKAAASIYPFLKAETPRECIYMGWIKDEDELIEAEQDSKVIIFGRQAKVIVNFGNALAPSGD